MRRALVPCLLAVLPAWAADDAQAPARSVAEILHAHAAALGDFAKVVSLTAESELRSGGVAVRGVRTAWSLPGRCLREFPAPERGAPRVEWFGPEGAFVSAGQFERYRPGQRTTRAGYYLARALAEPWPLRGWIGRDAAQAGLSIGASERDDVDVLFTGRDVFGVRAVFILDRASGQLLNLRYESEDNEPFVNLTYGSWRMVDGVALPASIDAVITVPQESEKKQAFVLQTHRRLERRAGYVVNPDVSAVDFAPPGPGEGGGTGFRPVTFRTGPDPYECAVGDLDGDGRNDVAVACEGGMSVTFGGATDAPVFVPLGEGHHRGMVIDDFDLDGTPEAVTASWVKPSGMLFRVSFDADRKPAIDRLYVAPGFCWSIAGGDFDRDGIGDLLLSGLASRSLDVKWGNGLGGFRQRALRWPLANSERPERRAFGVAVGDIDGDPCDDLAVCDGKALIVFQGQQNGSFLPTLEVPLPEGMRPVAVAMADLDGDGRDELVCAGSVPGGDLRHDLVIVRNRGDRLEPRDLVAAGARTEDVLAADLDGDGRPDLAVASFLDGYVNVLFNDGKGGFGRVSSFPAGRGPCRLATADWDGDGRADLLVTDRLDDTVTVLLNELEGGAAPAPAPERARVVAAGARADFRLEGLSAPYGFVCEFLVPADILDPSGIAAMGASEAWSGLVFVSDKESSLFRATLDRANERLLVGPRIPLRGLGKERLDLEAVAWDPHSPNLFLGCEADSSVIRATLFGTVLGRVPTGVESEGNDGIEGVALRRKPDNTPLLYVFKERWGTTLRPPTVRCFGLEEDPFRIVQRGEPFTLPVATPDQSDAAIDGERCFVVGRMQRRIFELHFDGDGFAKDARYADYGALSDGVLGLMDPDVPIYGLVEGIAVDPRCGDLFLVVDHNGKAVGKEGLNRAAAGRVLWFRCLAQPERRPEPRRVTLRTIVVATEAAARECWRRAREGEDFGRLAEEYRVADAALPADLRVVHEGVDPLPGERPAAKVAPALRSVAFTLEVGEVALCEYHAQECPEGWVVVLRSE